MNLKMQNLFAMLSHARSMPAPERRLRQSGMALVIVLGVLSVMLMMAMSFTVIMSTERTASANRIADMRLRHMLETALARAAADIAADLGDDVYPPWQALASPLVNTNSFTNFGLFAEDYIYPVSNTFAIDTKTWQQELITTLYINMGLVYGVPNGLPNKHKSNFRNDMTNYVPGALLADAEYTNSGIYWQPICFTNTIGVYTGKVQSMTVTTVVGRVCYLVLNCSGLWDANYVGGRLANGTLCPRQSGANVREVDLNSFKPEIGNADLFLNQRADDVRYDSLPDLYQSNLRQFSDNAPSNLFVYSYARTGSWDSAANSVTGALYLGTAAEIAAAPAPIINAFDKWCGLDTPQSGWAYTNLYRYLNPYPFVTEICVENNVTFSDPNYLLDTEIFLEVWWPYPSEIWDPDTKVNVAVTFLDGDDDRRPDDYTMTENAVTVNPDSPFKYITIKWSKDCGPASPNYNRARIDYQIFSPRSKSIVFNNSVVVTLAGSWPAGNGSRHGSTEVVDPRFAGDPAWWRNRAGLSTNVNQAKEDFRANPANAAIVDDWDDWDGIGCSTTNRLLTLGELGFIAYAPWQTINLTNSAHAKVFDVFRLDQQTHYHGLFNPNSMNRDALASAFANMPVDYYANEPSTWRVLPEGSELIAESIITNGPYTNISDLAKREIWEPIFSDPAFLSRCTDKPTREALIRNSFGLFNVRQNVFEILLAAEAAGIDGRFAMRPARARAVAIVWRDPYTGRMFLRSIKYLRD